MEYYSENGKFPRPLPSKVNFTDADGTGHFIPEPTEAKLTAIGWYTDGRTPADEPPVLAAAQTYSSPVTVDGRTSVIAVDRDPAEVIAENISMMKMQGEMAVEQHIQSVVNTYNETHGLVFANAHACANYRDITGYTHQQFCDDVWLWNVSVWEAARVIIGDVLAGNRTAPTVDELVTELPPYTGVI